MIHDEMAGFARISQLIKSTVDISMRNSISDIICRSTRPIAMVAIAICVSIGLASCSLPSSRESSKKVDDLQNRVTQLQSQVNQMESKLSEIKSRSTPIVLWRRKEPIPQPGLHPKDAFQITALPVATYSSITECEGMAANKARDEANVSGAPLDSLESNSVDEFHVPGFQSRVIAYLCLPIGVPAAHEPDIQ